MKYLFEDKVALGAENEGIVLEFEGQKVQLSFEDSIKLEQAIIRTVDEIKESRRKAQKPWGRLMMWIW